MGLLALARHGLAAPIRLVRIAHGDPPDRRTNRSNPEPDSVIYFQAQTAPHYQDFEFPSSLGEEATCSDAAGADAPKMTDAISGKYMRIAAP